MTYIFSRNTRRAASSSARMLAARAIGAAPRQAPCIIRNRPIKAFDQAPLCLCTLSPGYRRALAFLSSPATWRLSLRSLPSSPLSSSPSLSSLHDSRVVPPGDLPHSLPSLPPFPGLEWPRGKEKEKWGGRGG